jgi:hypothetical protein
MLQHHLDHSLRRDGYSSCHVSSCLKIKKQLKNKNTIIRAKGAKVSMVSQGQGWSSVNMWPQFVGIVHEINIICHKK